MSDPDIALIQGAALALNTTDARINGFLDSIDAAIATRQAAYAALAANLAGVVKDQMYSLINWTPTAVADDPENGVFKTWDAVCDYILNSPAGSYTRVHLSDADDAAVYLVDKNLSLTDTRAVKFTRTGGVRTLTIASEDDGGNAFFGIVLHAGCLVELSFVGIHFGPLVTVGAGIKSNAAFIRQVSTAVIKLHGPLAVTCAEAGRVVHVLQYGGICQINAENPAIDGDITFLGGQADSIALLSVRGGSFQNGAILYDTGAYTVGQNMLYG